MTQYTKIEVDVQTGEQRVVELTPEEIAEILNRPSQPLFVPQIISDRQFFQQAAISGIITEDEALAAVSIGAIPTVLQTIVDGIPDSSQQFAAKMLLSGATTFDRSHPLTEVVRASLGWTTAQIDQFFIDAFQL